MQITDSAILRLTVLVPLVAGTVVFIMNSYEKAWSGWKRRLAGATALAGFILPALGALKLAAVFSEETLGAHGYAFLDTVDLGLGSIGVYWQVGLNGIALPLYLMAAIVGFAAGLYALQSKADRATVYWALLLWMHGGLMGVFSSVDLIGFYFFHELALIPTFVMIGLWGGRAHRTIAMELTLYLTVGALLVLAGLLMLSMGKPTDAIELQSGASFDLIHLKAYLAEHPLSEGRQHLVFGLLLFGFGILVSLFPFHSWAPRGYSVAPTGAAMLHAGVLKKFGLYGLIQIAAPLLPLGAERWAPVLAWLALGNVLLIGWVTIAQRSLKQMIGYSSVMHMGLAFLGVASLSVLGWSGAVMLMFAHGLSVALLLMLSTCIKQRCGTDDMAAVGGLGPKAPVLAAFFVAAVMASIGLPGFANFWGELAVFVSLWEYQRWLLLPAVAGLVISAVYGLRAIGGLFFGRPTEGFKSYSESQKGGIGDLIWTEKLPALILLIPLLVVGIWPNKAASWVHHALAEPEVMVTVAAPSADAER